MDLMGLLSFCYNIATIWATMSLKVMFLTQMQG